MRTFRVWAPTPGRVEIKMDGICQAMVPGRAGWWSAEVPSAAAGSEYGFVLDGEGPFPDPRSAWQPNGVEGLSRCLDHDTFPWSDTGWQAPPLASAVIYELHIGTFTAEGTFDAAVAKLDHLVQLGITHVELMPIVEFPGTRGWGYDGVDLFAPYQGYGGPEGLKRFVDACHGRRLAVLLDVVCNHLGPSGNHLARFGPYFTSVYRTPWGEAINFDGPDSDEVRRFFCDNALMWLRDYHVDGLRLDAVHAIHDTSAVPWLEQLAREVRELAAQTGRHLVLIPESDSNDPRLLWPRQRGGFEFDAQWSDDFHHALHSVLTGERDGYYADFGALADLAKALRQAFVLDGGYSVHRRRRHGRCPAGLSGHRFVAYLQNHDQVGNRAKGERSSQLVSAGRLKVGAALVFTSPFVPLLFQGEEWGASTPFLYFTDHQDPRLAEAVRVGRQREFAATGWRAEDIPDPQAATCFERSKLDWSELTRSPNADLLEWHRQLIRLRRVEPDLSNGRMQQVNVRFDESARWLVAERGAIDIVVNLGPEPRRVPIRPGPRLQLLASENDLELSPGAVVLPPDAVTILK